MKNNARYDEPVRPTGISLCRALARLIALITATTLLAAVAAPPGQSRGTKLKPGDIIYVDSGDGPDGGFVLKVDPVTRKTSVIGSGGHLQLPYGVVIDTNKQIIVSDSGRLIGVNPENGNQSVIADLAQAGWGQPFQIALDSRGFIIAATLQAIVRIDPSTGQAARICDGGNSAIGVALGEMDELYVLTVAPLRQILRVNIRTCVRKVISEGQYLRSPQSILVVGADIYVTDVATLDGNFGVGCIIHVNADDGGQTILSKGGLLVGPVGIAGDRLGELVVGDPYTINPQSRALHDGAIVLIHPLSGQQTLLTRGEGSTVNPRGVGIVPGAR